MNLQIKVHELEEPLFFQNVGDIYPYFDEEQKAIFWRIEDYDEQIKSELAHNRIAGIRITEMRLSHVEQETITWIARYIFTLNKMTANKISTNARAFAYQEFIY